MPRHFDVDELVDWMSLSEATTYLEQITHNKYSRATLYYWAKKGWLGTNGFRPLKTTRKMLRSCAEQHLAVGPK